MVKNTQPAWRSSGEAKTVRGRGTATNPDNRFERLSLDVASQDDAPVDIIPEHLTDGRTVRTAVYEDHSKTVINRVDSPDLPFNWTINPYRGCEHGCVYCYARPTHETLGFSAGLDFESKIMAKFDAPELLRKELAKPSWNAEPIVMSGVTDPYQPIETRGRITRRILEVMVEARQPVSIVTKSRLILRDLDLLTELARHNAVRAAISITTLDNDLAAKMEPRASAPRDRLWAIQRLASAGIPVTVMVAPIIPAITDREAPRILKAAADAGARAADYVMLRLPHANKTLFDDWLARHFPGRREHVQSLMRQMSGGESVYDHRYGVRRRGQGPYARQVEQTFDVYRRRVGLDEQLPPMSRDAFRRPDASEQMSLFDAA